MAARLKTAPLVDSISNYKDYLSIMEKDINMTLAMTVAKLWMDASPQLMRRMREHVMVASVGALTMPQYRILANINRGLSSIGAIADHHGVAQPSMSKMINLMVARGLIVRRNLHSDKRQSVLSLSSKGQALFLNVRGKAQKRIADKLEELKVSDVQKLEKSFCEIKKVLEKWS